MKNETQNQTDRVRNCTFGRGKSRVKTKPMIKIEIGTRQTHKIRKGNRLPLWNSFNNRDGRTHIAIVCCHRRSVSARFGDLHDIIL